ncbi:MAG: hypothetical protein AYL29_001420 [Candidatus Bathyarchaeota archaeon B24]|nr:MAG: hypothetical protein AYL29_001420 [Candidatus Bathyarchaeota archaeon B24]RLI26704.1 MAG: hypothetical protein DRO57_00255 [Candidatus Bathyarchaeota archaeon]
MSEIEVRVKLGEMETSFTGKLDDVMEAVFEWLSKVYPAYEAISKIVYEPNLDRLMRECSDLLTITEGGIILRKTGLTAEEAITLSLVGAYIGFRIGKLEKECMTPAELSRTTGKALKTIYNTLASMVKQGRVVRESGEYKLTKLHIAKFVFDLLPRLKE